ncbi:cupin domain-containing protein [Paraburkholderia unamae]|uniref:Quercetin dioxygenase-like cupin family protein n=1 Tax=Paraburkholderia unamae TaxID=219649 RepID=A0ABX5KBL2_9BURK|nr:cupin domain-containing protein [Paraburkholderia unamae]PVX70984.1 quercetin dioxygenase-like cupin family protein [Paraburkholderia unamae]
MKVFHGRAEGGMSEQRGATFSGTVWADPVMPPTDGVTINTVFFAPRGRTYWHTHEHGQVLQVTAGKGWICKEGEQPQEIRQGDIVFIGPNERHWHGASDASYMVHVATSLGKATWQEEVTEGDYPQGQKAR